MRVRRGLAAAAATALVAGFGIAGAAPASADQVWHQSVGRTSATAECPTTTESDLAIGWSSWAPSWAQWPNEGKGGYVCDRWITWAKDTPPPSGTSVATLIGCQLYASGGYYDFGYLPYLAGPVDGYPSSDCTTGYGELSFGGLGLVYAPGGLSDATALCAVYFPSYRQVRNFGSDVYFCDIRPPA